MEETKVIYYVDDEETPYMMKIPLSPTKVKLSDLKGQLNRPFKKFFFKTIDDDIGVVKEEIIEDESSLPNAKGRIVCWVVSEGSASGSDVGNKTDLESLRGKDEDDISILSGVSKTSSRYSSASKRRHHHHHHRKHHRHSSRSGLTSRTNMDSTTEISNPTDLDGATSFYETDDTASRLSVETTSTITSLKQPKQKKYTKKRVPRSLSMSTMTTSTMSDASVQMLTVTLNMDAYNFLGISIVGHANDDGVGGIYVGTVMKGGAVAADGRIESGDMLIRVNNVGFENMSNDDAVRTLREIVQQPGPITLTVAKCYDTEPYVPMFEPRMEPILPLDPSAWVMHTNMQRGEYGRPFTGSPTLSTMTSNSSPSLASSIPESERDLVKLTLTSPMYRVAKAMAAKESGLEVKDRMWLKMTIPNSFIGSELVDWLHNNVDGFIDRRHSRKYAALMLKQGFIQHTVNKITFSEQCYYVFGNFKKAAANNLSTEFSQMHMSDNSGGDTDTLGPLPGMSNGIGWSSSDDQISLPPYEGVNPQYYPQRSSQSPENLHHSGSHGSSSSGASGTTRQTLEAKDHSRPSLNGRQVPPYHMPYPGMRHSNSLSSTSEFTSVSQQQLPHDRMSLRSANLHQAPQDGSGSLASFQQAIDNPCEYFIDVM